MDTNQLITSLSVEAAVSKPARSPWWVALRWMLGVTLYVGLIASLSHLRPDLIAKLGNPLFMTELLSLLAVMLSGCISAALLAYPDVYQQKQVAWLPLLFFTGFVAAIALALTADNPPAAAPAHDIECTICIIAYATLPGAWIFYSIRQFASTHYRAAGGIATLTAFSIGALVLRLSEPTDSIAHLLQFHYLPMLLAGFAGLLLGKLFLRW